MHPFRYLLSNLRKARNGRVFNNEHVSRYGLLPRIQDGIQLWATRSNKESPGMQLASQSWSLLSFLAFLLLPKCLKVIGCSFAGSSDRFVAVWSGRSRAPRLLVPGLAFSTEASWNKQGGWQSKERAAGRTSGAFLIAYSKLASFVPSVLWAS